MKLLLKVKGTPEAIVAALEAMAERMKTCGEDSNAYEEDPRAGFESDHSFTDCDLVHCSCKNCPVVTGRVKV
jgi:hypothetical protein